MINPRVQDASNYFVLQLSEQFIYWSSNCIFYIFFNQIEFFPSTQPAGDMPIHSWSEFSTLGDHPLVSTLATVYFCTHSLALLKILSPIPWHCCLASSNSASPDSSRPKSVLSIGWYDMHLSWCQKFEVSTGKILEWNPNIKPIHCPSVADHMHGTRLIDPQPSCL